MDPSQQRGFMHMLNSSSSMDQSYQLSQFPMNYPTTHNNHNFPSAQFPPNFHGFSAPEGYHQASHSSFQGYSTQPAHGTFEASGAHTSHVPPPSYSPAVPEDINSGDSSEEEERRGTRKNWHEQDNIKLVSAWLNNSIDPIGGAGKKGDYYWKKVADDYNASNPIQTRSAASLKDHWGKINKKVVHFNGVWSRLNLVYTSGQSDDMLMDKARKQYKQEAGHYFTLDYVWKIVREQPKWRRTYPLMEKTRASVSKGLEDTDQPDANRETRPEGTEAAKRKGKANQESSFGNIPGGMMQQYFEAQSRKSAALEKIADASQEKVQADLIDRYMKLMVQDTSEFCDEQMDQHHKLVAHLENKLFS